MNYFLFMSISARVVFFDASQRNRIENSCGVLFSLLDTISIIIRLTRGNEKSKTKDRHIEPLQSTLSIKS
ncbi:MAG TPA: hypothetical protein VJ899_09195 [Salegentibacter sp.]|nr:hypothetical protein [Salegentibacter sp.]